MGDPSEENTVAGKTHQARPVPSGVFILWSFFAMLALILASGAIVVRLMAGPRFDGLLMVAACVSALLLALRIPKGDPVERATSSAPASEPLREILDSAGPALIAISTDLRLTYVNPAGERLLGYDAVELMSNWHMQDVLAHGEGARLVSEMQKLSGVERYVEQTPTGRMAAYLECVRLLPPSMVPSFDAKLRRKDGLVVPVTLQISALRDAAGSISGLVAVAFDQTATMRQEQDLRESQERFRDLFEHSSEMIATLSPAGRFLVCQSGMETLLWTRQHRVAGAGQL